MWVTSLRPREETIVFAFFMEGDPPLATPKGEERKPEGKRGGRAAEEVSRPWVKFLKMRPEEAMAKGNNGGSRKRRGNSPMGMKKQTARGEKKNTKRKERKKMLTRGFDLQNQLPQLLDQEFP